MTRFGHCIIRLSCRCRFTKKRNPSVLKYFFIEGVRIKSNPFFPSTKELRNSHIHGSAFLNLLMKGSPRRVRITLAVKIRINENGFFRHRRVNIHVKFFLYRITNWNNSSKSITKDSTLLPNISQTDPISSANRDGKKSSTRSSWKARGPKRKMTWCWNWLRNMARKSGRSLLDILRVGSASSVANAGIIIWIQISRKPRGPKKKIVSFTMLISNGAINGQKLPSCFPEGEYRDALAEWYF